MLRAYNEPGGNLKSHAKQKQKKYISIKEKVSIKKEHNS